MIRGVWETRQIFIDGIELNPDISRRIRDHSPDGFNWGYGGSGPAQLALALMLYFAQDAEEALALYQDFKWEIVSALPQGDFQTPSEIVDLWIKSRRISLDDGHRVGM